MIICNDSILKITVSTSLVKTRDAAINQFHD